MSTAPKTALSSKTARQLESLQSTYLCRWSDDVHGAVGAVLPAMRELVASIDAADRAGLAVRFVHDDVACRREAADDEQVPVRALVRRSVELAGRDLDARDDRNAACDEPLDVGERREAFDVAGQSVL